MVSRPLTVELDKFVSVLCIKYHLSFTLIVDAIGFKLYKEIIFIFGGCCSFAGGGCSSGRTYGRRGNVVFGATTMLIIYTRIYFIKKTLYCNQVAGHFRLMGGLIFTRLVDFSPPFD